MCVLSGRIARFRKIETVDKIKCLISQSIGNGYLVQTRKSYQVAAHVRRERGIQDGVFQVQLFGGYGLGFPLI